MTLPTSACAKPHAAGQSENQARIPTAQTGQANRITLPSYFFDGLPLLL